MIGRAALTRPAPPRIEGQVPRWFSLQEIDPYNDF
jgi:hypothetical protein